MPEHHKLSELDTQPVMIECAGFKEPLGPKQDWSWGFVSLTVEADGSVSNVEPARLPGLGPEDSWTADRELANRKAANVAMSCVYRPGTIAGVPVVVRPVNLGLPFNR
jgi:hypothetical protein